jgi:hypothetical protein
MNSKSKHKDRCTYIGGPNLVEVADTPVQETVSWLQNLAEHANTCTSINYE